jgi:HEAT repeat protein
MNPTQQKRNGLSVWTVWWSSHQLQSKNPQVRRKAIERVRKAAARLTYSKEDWTTSVLVKALEDPEPDIRACAASALRRMGWTPANAQERASFEVARGNIRGAGLRGNAAVGALLLELQHRFSCQRRAAAEALESLTDPRRVKPLLSAMKDEDTSVLVWAAHALSQENSNEVRATLGKLFRNPDPRVRLAAAQALANQGDPADKSFFLELLRDTSFEVRLIAVQFLASFPDPQNTPALLSMLSDYDADVRHAAAKALGMLRSRDAIERLVVGLGDEDRLVRQAAEASLDQIDPDWAHSACAQRAISVLEATQHDCQPWVRAAINQVLARIRTPTPQSGVTSAPLWVRL